MNEVAIILSTLAVCLSVIALVMGCIAVSICVGLKNSTHTIQWKTLDNPFQEEAEELLGDPMSEGTEPGPTNRAPKKRVNPEDYAFMDDVTDQSNF